MPEALLRRHGSGPVARVSTYVKACFSLDSETLGIEYRNRVAAAPTRTQPYIVEHDISGRTDVSTRLEELLAHRMFQQETMFLVPGWRGVRVVDFQTPLNARRSDGLGEVDLLGVGDGLCVIELKVLRPDGGADTPLNALLEAVGYCAVIEANAGRIMSELRGAGHEVGTGPPSALVLAPDDYWARWDRTRTEQPWKAALAHAIGVVGEAPGLTVVFGSFEMADVGETLRVTDPLM
jgi:hypothetical protein